MGKRSKRKKAQQRLGKAERRATAKATERHLPAPYFPDNLGNILRSTELVFAILRRSGKGQFEAVGTGFFFHPAGGFVTAKHCLYSGEIYDPNCVVVQTIGNHHFLREIQYFESHSTGDIGVGMLKGNLKNKYTGELVLIATLPVSLTPAAIDDKIATLAYPRMTISKKNVGKFICDQYKGQILDYLPEGTGRLRSPCFLTNMEIKSGSSGGPVLRDNHVIGVNSSSFDMAATEEPISFITPIQQIFDLTLKESDGTTTSIQELMHTGHMDWVA